MMPAHDPFSPDAASEPRGMDGGIPDPGALPETRYHRVGATDEQIAQLHSEWDGLTDFDRVTENQRIASLHDDDLRAELHARPVGSLTVQEILEQVGDDPALARRALDIERAGRNRKTLVDRLEDIVTGGVGPTGA